MMKEANPGKDKKDWQLPSGYKIAPRIAVDKAKAKDAKDRGTKPVKKRVTSVSRDDIIEEQVGPHAHADESLGADDDAGTEKLDDAGMVKLDRQIRLTVKDFKQFGWTENCPRCLE